MPDLKRPSSARLATTAIVLLALFPVTVLALNLVQLRHYDALRDAVSLLALGTGGAAMNVAFFSLGLGIALAALLLRKSIRAGVAGPVLLTVAALAAVTSGIFHTNADGAAATTESDVHMVAGITVFLAMVAAMFVFVRRFRREPRWRGFARPTLIWALAGAVTFVLIPVVGDPRFGLAQRLHIATWLSWLLVTAVLVRRAAASEQEAGQPPVQAVDPGPFGIKI